MMISKLEEAWLSHDYLFKQLKIWIDSAEMANPKTWEPMEDRKAKARLLDMVFKLRKDYKSDTVINIVNAFAAVPKNEIY